MKLCTFAKCAKFCIKIFAKCHKYLFSGESEILLTSGRGKNNVYFEQPMSDRLLSQELVEAANGHSVTSVRPYFSTKGTIYRVKIGSSVTMACEIVNLGKCKYVYTNDLTYDCIRLN